MSAQSVIRNFMSALDATSKSGTDALDEAVASVSNFSSWSELIDTMAKDCAAYNGDGTAFLKDMCGIVLDNADTGAISGSDAGGSTVKTAESIVPENGTWSYPSSSSFTVNGLTVKIDDFDNLDEKEKWIVGALYTWWVKESLSLINSSFGFNFNESGTTVTTLTIYFYNSSDGNMAISQYSKGQKSTELRLNLNMHYYEDIDTSDPNGGGSAEALVTLDRTIAHELVHAVMSANVDYYNDLPVSFKEGSAELVHGIDDKRREQIDSLSKSSTSLKSAMNGSGVSSYAAGYMVLRYLAKQADANRDPDEDITPSSTTDNSTTDNSTTDNSTTDNSTTETIGSATTTFDGTTLKIVGATNSDVWLGGTNPFTGETNAYGNASAIILDASEVTDVHCLGGNTNSNLIIAGNAGSSLWGGTNGNDTMQGNSGVDNFWFLRGGGNDTALNFQTGATGDVLTFFGGGIVDVYREQNNFEVTLDDGSVLNVVSDDDSINNVVKYTADGSNVLLAKVGNTNDTNDFTWDGDNIAYLGGNGFDAIHVFTEGANVNIAAVGSNIEAIDASTSGGGNVLIGNSGDNTLVSGGNNSLLRGAAGDDVMYGNSGVDNFWFARGYGNDTALNFQTGADGDVLTFFDGGIVDVYREQNNFAVTLDDGSVLNVVSDDDSINNVVKYTADGSNVLLAKVGNTNDTNDFTWDGDNIAYLGGNGFDAIHVFTEGANVNIAAVGSNIEAIDASTSGGGNVLIGNSGDNTLVSGGNNSLLRGAAGDDVMYGNSGVDTFMFGAGDGNDIIYNAEDDDVINIHNANLSDITVNRTDFGAEIGVGGSTLTVVGQNNPTVTFADGSSSRLLG